MYFINTNGLLPTLQKPSDKDGDNPHTNQKYGKGVLLDKQRLLSDIYTRQKLDALCLCETHNTVFAPKGSAYTESSFSENIHGTSVITRREATNFFREVNVAAHSIVWEEQPLWIISAYFPNREEDTEATIRALEKLLRRHKGARMLLVGDFNSTRTLAKEDTGGILPPSTHRRIRAGKIQDFLSSHSFQDLWNTFQNVDRDEEERKLTHLTHWNNDHTRGVRIDRAYANFRIKEGILSVSTEIHPGSDHKAIKIEWSRIPPPAGAIKPPPLPFRAYELAQVKAEITKELSAFVNTPMDHGEILQKWENTKKSL